MADKLSWVGLIVGWVLVLVLVLVIAGIFHFLHSNFVSNIFYAILGFLLIAYDAVNNSIQSAASSVGGGGVLVALVLAFIALVMAHSADDKTEELAKKVEELQEKLEQMEEDE